MQQNEYRGLADFLARFWEDPSKYTPRKKDNLFILITLGKQKMFDCEKKTTANINFQNGNANYETELEKLLRTSFKAKCRICVLRIQWKDTIY